MSTASRTAPVPLCDLRVQFESIKDEVRSAIDRVLESQAFINGPEVGQLERAVASHSQAGHAIGCSSGSDALLLALMALGVGPGDEVVTSPFTFFATVGAIARLGAKPVFVDIDPATFNLDPTKLPGALTPRTKAIIPVHLFGQMAEMDPIMTLAEARGLAVVEDAAQAIGAEDQGRRAGSIGRIGCLSFFPSKNLGALGDGGLVLTSDPALAETLRVLRVHGAKTKYYHTLVGGNFRLDTIHAAALLVKLRHLDRWNEARRGLAARYRTLIESSPAAGRYVLPVERAGARHVYNQFVIRAKGRDALAEFLKTRGIGTAVYYPRPMHLQECFAGLGHGEGAFPESERACREVLALPMFPELAHEQQEAVVSALAEAAAR